MAGYLRTIGLTIIFGHIISLTHGGVTRTDSRLRDAFKDAFQSYTCLGTDARMCSGNGACRNGQCTCDIGFSGSLCDVSDSTREVSTTGVVNEDVTRGPEMDDSRSACSPNDDVVCSGHGVCLTGQCRCEPNWSGAQCGVSMHGGFCQAYKECAECTALLQTCPAKCESQGNFELVYGFKAGMSFHRCRQRVNEMNCTYYYQLKEEYPNGVKDIEVKACIPVPGPRLTTTTESDDGTHGDADKSKGGPDSGVSRYDSNMLAIISVMVLIRSVEF